MSLNINNQAIINQKIFRKILEAMANPGRIVKVETMVEEKECSICHVLAKCLLDDNVTFCFMDNVGLEKVIKISTHAEISKIENADYIFIENKCFEENVKEILNACKKGTLSEPGKNATLFILLDNIIGDTELRFFGPGLKNEEVKLFDKSVVTWLETRQKVGIDFPCGIDMMFVTNQGEMMAFPRLIAMLKNKKEVIREWDM